MINNIQNDHDHKLLNSPKVSTRFTLLSEKMLISKIGAFLGTIKKVDNTYFSKYTHHC